MLEMKIGNRFLVASYASISVLKYGHSHRISLDWKGWTMRLVQFIAVVGTVVGMSACSSFTQMQDTVTKFDQGVHSASTAQMNLFHQVQAAECSRNLYVQAFSFATAKKTRDT